MMGVFPNKHRGEITANIEGKTWRLCLTLGALAELESAFGDTDMLALAERFEAGHISARDAILILGAGLRGGGHIITNEELAALQIDGGAAGYLALVVELLQATFAPADLTPALHDQDTTTTDEHRQLDVNAGKHKALTGNKSHSPGSA